MKKKKSIHWKTERSTLVKNYSDALVVLRQKSKQIEDLEAKLQAVNHDLSIRVENFNKLYSQSQATGGEGLQLKYVKKRNAALQDVIIALVDVAKITASGVHHND